MMYSSLRRISFMTVPSGEIVWPSNSEGFTRVMLTGEENLSKNGPPTNRPGSQSDLVFGSRCPWGVCVKTRTRRSKSMAEGTDALIFCEPHTVHDPISACVTTTGATGYGPSECTATASEAGNSFRFTAAFTRI
jgi:hypothetical protein